MKNILWFNKNKGFTIIELIVVITIIAVLSTIVIGSVNQYQAKARDTRRIADIRQIQKAFELYRIDNNGNFPIYNNGCMACLGVNDNSSCWGASCGGNSAKGSSALNIALKPYISVMPIDPSPGRGLGDRYLYKNGEFYIGCNTMVPGAKWLLWRPDKGTPTSNADCGGIGVYGCICPNCDYQCAVKLD